MFDFSLYGGIERFDSFEMHKEVANWLRSRFCLRDKRILDIGGGTGIQLSHLCDDNFCVNLDYSESATDYGREKHPGVLHIVSDVSRKHIPFGSNYFDFVFSIQVLEHVPEHDISFVLREIHRVIRHGCDFFLSVATVENIGDPGHYTLRRRDWWTKKISPFFECVEKTDSMYDWQVFFLRKKR